MTVRLRTALVVTALCLAAGAAQAQSPPTLAVEAPPALGAVKARLEAYDIRPLADIVRAVGLEQPGPPIRVVLATDDSEWSAPVASWVAGYAIGRESLVVLFPSRSPSYPQDSLEDVLRHEVAHVLIDRAAGGYPVPRWFHEGLAVVAERPMGMEDRVRLASELLFGRRSTLEELNLLFAQGQGTQSRAYSVSAAVVRDLIQAHGPAAPATILQSVAQGEPFAAALTRVTRRTIPGLEYEFWERQRTWTMWVPILGSSTVLWVAIIGLAALARRRRRARAADIRRRWEREGDEL